MTTTPYHRRFRHVDRRTIRATRDFVIAKPWRLTDRAVKQVTAQAFVDQLAAIYRMPSPSVTITAAVHPATHGTYSPWSHVISLSVEKNLSVVTLLHEFRHAMQHHTAARPTEVEDDARAWSLSVFAKAAPRRFARMVEAGRILHV